MRTYIYIWAFEVQPEHVEAFRQHYGEGGAWTQLFRRARGYLGTQLLQDEKDPLRFVTIDTWSSSEDYEAFQSLLRVGVRCARPSLRRAHGARDPDWHFVSTVR